MVDEPYCPFKAAFEEFKEVLDELHLRKETLDYWKDHLDKRLPAYARPRKIELDEFLESLKRVKGIYNYRVVEEPTGEISVYIRPVRAISHIDLKSVIKNEGIEFV